MTAEYLPPVKLHSTLRYSSISVTLTSKHQKKPFSPSSALLTNKLLPSLHPLSFLTHAYLHLCIFLSFFRASGFILRETLPRLQRFFLFWYNGPRSINNVFRRTQYEMIYSCKWDNLIQRMLSELLADSSFQRLLTARSLEFFLPRHIQRRICALSWTERLSWSYKLL